MPDQRPNPRNVIIVLDFCHAWSMLELERIMAFLTDDCFYHNIPMDPVTGTTAIRSFLEGFLGLASEAQFVVHHAAATGAGVVLTERTDRFKIKEKWVELPVMGIFELRDGKIANWRDYFDANQFNTQLAAASGGVANG